MTVNVTQLAKNNSPFLLSFSFTAEDGSDPTGITSINYALKKKHSGAVINDKSNEAVVPATADFEVLLDAADVVRTHGEPDERVVTLTIVYDSTKGSGLSYSEDFVFSIE